MSNASQPPYPPEFQEKLEHMQRISLDIRTLVNRHQQFETQLNENQMVKEVRKNEGNLTENFFFDVGVVS